MHYPWVDPGLGKIKCLKSKESVKQLGNLNMDYVFDNIIVDQCSISLMWQWF